MNWTEPFNINTTQTENMNNSSGDYYDVDRLDWNYAFKIAMPVQLGFIILGIPFNLIAFCIWMFGPKSKTLCCATYFALNAVADFLCCTIPGICKYTLWLCAINYIDFPHCYSDIPIYIYIDEYTSSILFALSNWISASITIERAFTILWPFVFKPQDMQKRSKYVVLGICVLLVSTFVSLIYFTSDENWKMSFQFDIAVRIVLPFTLIVTMNTAVVATLCRRKFQQNTRSTNQTRFVEIFTKITLLTGLAFVLSNALYVTLFIVLVCPLCTILNLDIISYNVFSQCMYFFNCLSNPVISFIVCKSVREDLWSFVCMIARKCRNTCQCRRPDQVPDPVHMELVVMGEDTTVMLPLWGRVLRHIYDNNRDDFFIAFNLFWPIAFKNNIKVVKTLEHQDNWRHKTQQELKAKMLLIFATSSSVYFMCQQCW